MAHRTMSAKGQLAAGYEDGSALQSSRWMPFLVTCNRVKMRKTTATKARMIVETPTAMSSLWILGGLIACLT